MIWLKAHLTMLILGLPVWAWLVGGAMLIVEDAIARSRLAANSTIQLVFGLLGHIPVIGAVLAKLGPPEKPAALSGPDVLK